MSSVALQTAVAMALSSALWESKATQPHAHAVGLRSRPTITYGTASPPGPQQEILTAPFVRCESEASLVLELWN